MAGERGCAVVVLRPFTVYGPGQPPDMFVASALAAALLGHPFEMSAGEQKRDLVFVEDVVEALLVAARTPGLEGRAVNVGTAQAHPLPEVAAPIWDRTGSETPPRAGARGTSPPPLHHSFTH